MLRFLGRHRLMLEDAVTAAFATNKGFTLGDIAWLDFPFDPCSPQGDGEWKSVDFLPNAGGVAWLDFWPDKRAGTAGRTGVPSWDAVALLRTNGRPEWLLIEAKARLGELRNTSAKCGAGGKSLATIKRSLKETWQASSGKLDGEWPEFERVWLGKDYQKANRLACLHFLNQINRTPARLLYIYFTGDSFRGSPVNAAGWKGAIDAQNSALGLAHSSIDRVHEIFLPVGSNIARNT